MLSRQVEEIGRDFFLRRMRAAEAHRQKVVRDSEAYRVVHGEGDLLPALVVDRYGEYLVVQTLDQGMDAAQGRDLSLPGEIFAPEGHRGAQRRRGAQPGRVAARNARRSQAKSRESVPVRMNGFTLTADLLHGQKTGIFLDQRENYRAAAAMRAAARRWIASPPPAASPCTWRRTAKRGGGGQLRPRAGHRARATRRRTASANIEFREADVFELLAGYASARRQFSTVVLDPPAFAKSRQQPGSCNPGYKEINLRALRLLGPAGFW